MRVLSVLLLTVQLFVVVSTAQEDCAKPDPPKAKPDWQTVKTSRISFRIPKDLTQIPDKCQDLGCYRFRGSELSLNIDTDSAAKRPSQPLHNQKFVFVDGVPAWLWRRINQSGEFKYSYGALYFSQADKNFRTGIDISSKEKDIGDIAERIFLSALVDSRLKSLADASASKNCACVTAKAAKRKPNPLYFDDIADKFRMTMPVKEVNRTLLAQIKVRGVAVDLSPVNLNLLVKSGASSELIGVIKNLSPPELGDQVRLYAQIVEGYAGKDSAGTKKAASAGREFLDKYWCDPAIVDQVSFAMVYVRRLESQQHGASH